MKSFFSFLKPGSAWKNLAIVAGLILSLFILQFLDNLFQIRAFLDRDSLSISLGEIRFSIYFALKSLFTIFILFWLTSLISTSGQRRILNLQRIKSSNRAILAKIFQVIVYFIGFMFALDLLGIDLKALTLFSGAIGIGLGFGLQKITSNFISGLILLFEKSVEINDLVQLSDGTAGYIRHTGARYLLVETFDGKEVMVPNEEFITQHVTNLTYSHDQARIDFIIRVAYDSDLNLVMKLILEAIEEHPKSLDSRAPSCYLKEFAEGSIHFQVFFWVDDINEGLLGPKSDVLMSIWNKFKANDISIPLPQQEVYVSHTPQSSK